MGKRLLLVTIWYLTLGDGQTVEEMEREYNEMTKEEDPATSPSEEKKAVQKKPLHPSTEAQESDAMKIYEMTKRNPVTRNLFVWLRYLKLKKFRSERIRNDLANGYVVAEVLSKFFPAQISTHSFDLAIHSKAKKDNWLQLKKFFRRYSKFGEILKQRDIDILVDPTVGISGNDAGIHVLLDVYRFLFKCKLVPKLSSWGQGEVTEGNCHYGTDGRKGVLNIYQPEKKGGSGGENQERKIELLDAEKARIAETHRLLGYRLILDILVKIKEAMEVRV